MICNSDTFLMIYRRENGIRIFLYYYIMKRSHFIQQRPFKFFLFFVIHKRWVECVFVFRFYLIESLCWYIVNVIYFQQQTECEINAMEQEKSHKRNTNLTEINKNWICIWFLLLSKENKRKEIDNHMNIFYDGDWQHITDFY